MSSLSPLQFNYAEETLAQQGFGDGGVVLHLLHVHRKSNGQFQVNLEFGIMSLALFPGFNSRRLNCLQPGFVVLRK